MKSLSFYSDHKFQWEAFNDLPSQVLQPRDCLLKKSKQTHDSFLSKCPIIVPSCFTATAYLFMAFLGSLQQ